MSKFIVLYLFPTGGLDEWMKTDPEVRKVAEEKMQSEWNAWAKGVGSQLIETRGAGKTKRVTLSGVEDIKNNIMLYSVVEAESHDAAAKLFEGHPHLQIPGGTIEIMAANPLPGMDGF